MTATIRTLGIDRLPAGERADLALAIWDSLGAEKPGCRLSAAQLAEIDRRTAEFTADPSIGLMWEQVRSDIEAGR